MDDATVKDLTVKIDGVQHGVHQLDVRLARMEESLCGRQAICTNLLAELKARSERHEQTLYGKNGLEMQIQKITDVLKYAKYHVTAFWIIVSGIVVRLGYDWICRVMEMMR